LEAVNYRLQVLTKKIPFGVHVSTFLSDSNSVVLLAFEKRYVRDTSLFESETLKNSQHCRVNVPDY